MDKLYYRKIVDEILKYIDSQKIIVIHGSRQVGKTSIMKILIDRLQNKNISKENIAYIDLEDFTLLDLFNRGVKSVIDYFDGLKYNKNFKRYIFIDEIQYLDNPSGFLKLFNDQYHNQFQLIVSSSSSFKIKSKFKDSLVGRTVDFEVFGLDFEEYLEFNETKYDLKDIKSEIMNEEIKKYFIDYVLYSNYPGIVIERDLEKKENYLKQIISTYIKKDIKDISNIKNISKFNSLIRILSEQSGNLVNILELSNSLGISRETIHEYLLVLENTYIIKLITPFYKRIRTELTKMPKIFFEDTGLMILLNYLSFIKKITGEVFENSIYIILRKQFPVENIYYWRTNKGQEIDFIVEIEKTKYFAFEVKLNYTGQSLSSLKYFMEEYRNVENFIVTLQKTSTLPSVKEINNKSTRLIYPWEIKNLKG